MTQFSVWKCFCVSAVIFLFICSLGYAQEEEPEIDISKLFDKGEKFEIEVHFGQWSLNLLKGLFEEDLIDELSDEIRDEIITEVRERHNNIGATDFEQDLTFDSGGSNYGLEIRFYPKGREGAFSLGFSIDKTRMRLTIEGPVSQNFQDGTSAVINNARGEVTLNPLFTNLNFRWDFMPSWRVTPYFVFGLGVAALNGDISYEYLGTYQWAGPDEEVGDSETKPIKEAEEDFDFNMPNIIPLLQMNLGVRAEVIPQLHIRAEAGIWDGIILRAGVAYLF
jgi:hypothetical protein